MFFFWKVLFQPPWAWRPKGHQAWNQVPMSFRFLFEPGLILCWCGCFLFIYWPRCTICVQDLSPLTNQGLNLGPQAVKARSPKHRPTREVLPFGALRQGRQEAWRSSQPPEIKHYCPLHLVPAQARIMPGLAPPRPRNPSCPLQARPPGARQKPSPTGRFLQHPHNHAAKITPQPSVFASK